MTVEHRSFCPPSPLAGGTPRRWSFSEDGCLRPWTLRKRLEKCRWNPWRLHVPLRRGVLTRALQILCMTTVSRFYCGRSDTWEAVDDTDKVK